MTIQDKIAIIGSGLAGSLLALELAKKGYTIDVFEKRPDMRQNNIGAGRSINLALSHRGWKALEQAGLSEVIRKIALPMYSRCIHTIDGKTFTQPYSHDNQAIYSVSRSEINKLLMTEAEKNKSVSIYFEHECSKINLSDNNITLRNNNNIIEKKYDVILGADGAFSALRQSYLRTDGFQYQQHYEAHGYKELNIPSLQDGGFALDPTCLHIWPRQHFMLIALPNTQGDFTCTLFLDLHGKVSFEALQNENEVVCFFQRYFNDALALMPHLIHDFFHNPTSSLVTIKCNPWHRGNTCIMGDAAHAIIPFYGQGMNCSFEDVRLFTDMLTQHNQWQTLFEEFSNNRKPNADAIAEMACENFIEMRDLSALPEFQAKKKIDQQLAQLFPSIWMPQYSMVTFSHTPYKEAQRLGKKQWQLVEEIYHNKKNVLEIKDEIEKTIQKWHSNKS